MRTLERVSWGGCLFDPPKHPNIRSLAVVGLPRYGLFSTYSAEGFVTELPHSCKEGYIIRENGHIVGFEDLSNTHGVVWC